MTHRRAPTSATISASVAGAMPGAIYKGVSRKGGGWCAQKTVWGKGGRTPLWLGSYDKEEEAAHAWDW